MDREEITRPLGRSTFMRIIFKKDYDFYHRALARSQKIEQAHRWLAEFDPFLAPLWKFLRDENHPTIDSTRDEMRRVWSKLMANDSSIRDSIRP